MNELKKSGPLKLRHGRLTTTLLDYLGVPYRKVKGVSFWDANKPILHEIWQELLDAAKDKFVSMHPDRPGGDEEACKSLSESLGRARSSFNWYLQSIPAPVTGNITVIPPRMVSGIPRQKGFRVTGLHKTDEALQIARRIREGATNGEIRKEYGEVHYRRLQRIRACVKGGIARCGCGQPSNHSWGCAYRASKRSDGEKWKAYVEKLTGRKLAPETIEKLRYKRSPETIKKMQEAAKRRWERQKAEKS